MTATRRLVLDLPAETVEMIEGRVAGGEIGSAGAYVAEPINDETARPLDVDVDGPGWRAVEESASKVARRIDAGEETTSPAEEVFARLRARLVARMGAETSAAVAAE